MIYIQVWRKSIYWFKRYTTLMTLKMRSRSPKYVTMICLCKFGENPSTGSKDIPFTRLWPWKWGQGHQKLISSKACPNDISRQVWWNSINRFKRYRGYKNLSPRHRLQRDPHWNQYVPTHLWWGDIMTSGQMNCWNVISGGSPPKNCCTREFVITAVNCIGGHNGNVIDSHF